MDVDRQLGPMLKSVVGPMLKKAADKVLLLSFIDLRYPHRITDTMDAQGYRGRYYRLAMAGCLARRERAGAAGGWAWPG